MIDSSARITEISRITTALAANRKRIVDQSTASIKASVEHYAKVDETELRVGLGLLLDQMIHLLPTGDYDDIQRTLGRIVRARIDAGLSMDAFLRANLHCGSAIRAVVQEADLDYGPVETVLVAIISCAGAIYTEVHTSRMMALEQDRVQALSEVERLRGISDMVAGVAHEVNTPLGIITNAASFITEALGEGAAERLQQDPELLTDLMEASALISANVERADRLVRSFKNLSVRHVTDDADEIDLVELTQDAVHMYRLNATVPSKITVELVDKTDGAAARFRGYPGHYTQVLLNLLANVEAYAYGPTGGAVEVRIEHAIEADTERVLVHVVDHGVGIAADHLPKVFDPFFTTGRSSGGAGLGMAIVHTLVTGPMQGEVRISSDLGQGTRVTVELPLRVVDRDV